MNMPQSPFDVRHLLPEGRLAVRTPWASPGAASISSIKEVRDDSKAVTELQAKVRMMPSLLVEELPDGSAAG